MNTTKKLFAAAVCMVLLGAVFMVYQHSRISAGTRTAGTDNMPEAQAYRGEADEQFHDTDSILVVANKKHALPSGYEPADLVRPKVEMLNECFIRSLAADALERMFAAAEADGVHLVLGSGYRAETLQRQLYEKYAAQYGQEAADSFSSRPGYSDHQTGLAVDISDHDARTYLTEEFENTPEGQWLIQHAYEYGFILRYPRGKEEITGYTYEPWHYRFVGKEAAAEIFNSGSWYAMEEYCDVEGGTYVD